MVGGHGIDVLDVDTKNDGVSFNDLPVEARDYGITLSPSGGAHFRFRPPDTAKVHLTCPANTSATTSAERQLAAGACSRSCPDPRGPNTPGATTSNPKPWDIDRLLDDNPPDIILTICENSGNLSKTANEGKHAATTHEISRSALGTPMPLPAPTATPS